MPHRRRQSPAGGPGLVPATSAGTTGGGCDRALCTRDFSACEACARHDGVATAGSGPRGPLGRRRYASFDLSSTGWDAAVAFFSSADTSPPPTILVSATPIVS